MTTKLDRDADAARLPDGAGPARLIVCERLGQWAVALRRELREPDVRVCETRSLGECRDMLGGHPTSFVIAELTRPGIQALLEWVTLLGRDFPLARVAVVADRELASCEWLTRESGAVHFCVSLREASILAQLAARHLHAAPQPQRTPTERIWDDLPWG